MSKLITKEMRRAIRAIAYTDGTADDAYHKARELGYTGPKSHKPGKPSAGPVPADIFEQRRETIETAQRNGPLVERAIKLNDEVGDLAEDIHDAIGQITETEPRKVRELLDQRSKIHNAVNNERGGVALVERALGEAIDYLEMYDAAGDLPERFQVLFPPLPKEPDDDE